MEYVISESSRDVMLVKDIIYCERLGFTWFLGCVIKNTWVSFET